jgi:hypothetical protein
MLPERLNLCHLTRLPRPDIRAAVCFVFFLVFLLRFGVLIGKTSDEVANIAYAMTMFGEPNTSGWAVPKPLEIVLFGITYWVTKNMFIVNMLSLVAAALLVYYVNSMINRDGDGKIPLWTFTILLMACPFSLQAVLTVQSALLSALFVIMAIYYLSAANFPKYTSLVIILLSFAGLTRPENWANNFVIILLVFWLRYRHSDNLRIHKLDSLYIIPLLMPLIWILCDYVIFKDMFYSAHIAKRYALEITATSPNMTKQGSYPGWIYWSFIHTFYLYPGSSWRTLIFVSLCFTGIVTMAKKQPRLLALISCAFFGTIFFYFLTFLNGAKFFDRFLFLNHVFCLLFFSIGVGRASKLFGFLRDEPLSRILGWGVACALVGIFLLPFRAVTFGHIIPEFERRSITRKAEDAAIDSIRMNWTNDEKSVFLTTLAIPPAKVSLSLGTGKGVYLIERLIGRAKSFGKSEWLPNLDHTTVYIGYNSEERGIVRQAVAEVEEKARRVETLFDEGGFRVAKCQF